VTVRRWRGGFTAAFQSGIGVLVGGSASDKLLQVGERDTALSDKTQQREGIRSMLWQLSLRAGRAAAPSRDSGEFHGGRRWRWGPMARCGAEGAHGLFGGGERSAGERKGVR
jgi:hypothetical protein